MPWYNRRVPKPTTPSVQARLERAAAFGLMRLPVRAQLALARALPTTPSARATLHAQFQALLGVNALRPPLQSQSVRAARQAYRGLLHMLSPAPVPMATSLDIQVPVPASGSAPAGEVLVRVHYPLPVSAPGPAIVFFHGGGFTVGDVEGYDSVCRDIAAQTGFPVASVDYRMGPEHPAPTSAEDCLAAWSYLVANAKALTFDPTRMAVMGDSAGGKLSAVVAQQTLARGETPPALQVLVYPGLDLENHYASSDRFGVGFGLEQATIDWFMAQYIDDSAKHRDTRVSPLLTEDLSGLAPAIVVVASDPLRDEGVLYAERLRAAGVPVVFLDYPHIIHGFFTMGGVVPVAAVAVAEVLGHTRSLLSGSA